VGRIRVIEHQRTAEEEKSDPLIDKLTLTFYVDLRMEGSRKPHLAK